MVIVQHKIADRLLGHHFTAMCIWPFLFVRTGVDLVKERHILNHEFIHARQQREMLWLFFFLWYGVEYMLRLVQHRNSQQAYRALAHEREASVFEDTPDYLVHRKAFAWIKYL
jgi:hypothetical protein